MKKLTKSSTKYTASKETMEIVKNIPSVKVSK